MREAESVLTRVFGHAAFRPAQRQVVRAVLAGSDVLAVLPTGGGKSLCYQVPALLGDGLTLVLSPLVSLMKDQVDALRRRGVPAAALHAGLTPGEQAEALAGVVRGELRLLFGAPERMAEGTAIELLARRGVARIAVDEAHCISEWGHDFRPAYRMIGRIASRLRHPPMLALTATATPAVRDDIERVCRLRSAVRVVAGFDRPNLRFEVRPVRSADDRDAALSGALREAGGPAIVYAAARARVERIAVRLRARGVAASAYHAGLTPEARRSAQEWFMDSGGGADAVVVATSAFGMGVDKPDVRLVVHDAMPASLESYYQEAGRAGRDGLPARCLLLFSWGDRRTPEHFVDVRAPLRGVVERVAIAASSRPEAVDAAAIAQATRIPLGVVAGAIDLLAQAGCVADYEDDGSLRVRLVAGESRARGLLARESADRAIYEFVAADARALTPAGAPLARAALPPGLGETGLIAALDRLQRDGIVAWRRARAGRRWTVARHGHIGLDWAALRARRSAAMARLDAMTRYATTRRCRRETLLEYFGEQIGHPCTGCDRCADPAPRRR